MAILSKRQLNEMCDKKIIARTYFDNGINRVDSESKTYQIFFSYC